MYYLQLFAAIFGMNPDTFKKNVAAKTCKTYGILSVV